MTEPTLRSIASDLRRRRALDEATREIWNKAGPLVRHMMVLMMNHYTKHDFELPVLLIRAEYARIMSAA
jgi:hypothetical protein